MARRRAGWRFRLAAVAGKLEFLARKEGEKAGSVAEAMANELRKIIWTRHRLPKKHLRNLARIIDSGAKSKMVRYPRKWKTIAREIKNIIQSQT